MKKSIKPSSQRVKHVPIRTCLACRNIGDKRGLVRIVKTSDNRVIVDETGKIPGRGAYLCRTRKCWEEGLKGTRLEHALRARLSGEDLKGLNLYLENFDRG